MATGPHHTARSTSVFLSVFHVHKQPGLKILRSYKEYSSRFCNGYGHRPSPFLLTLPFENRSVLRHLAIPGPERGSPVFTGRILK